jgi:hypothetical protein
MAALRLRTSPSPVRARSPSTDASYLAVNSSNVSSACASLALAADWEKARWAFQATGVERTTGARMAARLIFEVARTKDILCLN